MKLSARVNATTDRLRDRSGIGYGKHIYTKHTPVSLTSPDRSDTLPTVFKIGLEQFKSRFINNIKLLCYRNPTYSDTRSNNALIKMMFW